MIRLSYTLVLLAALAACTQPAEEHSGQAWRASDENGDKPGIGYELRNDNGKIACDAYILDPDFPHDFSHGRRAAMKIMEQTPTEITARVKWDRDLQATFRFQFREAHWPDSFQAVVSEIIDSQPYNTETYKFSRTK
jgi:hypothetical protein